MPLKCRVPFFWLILPGLILYALTLIPLIAGLMQFPRRKAIGSALIAASLLTPGYLAGQWALAKRQPDLRTAEIASWPRTTLSAADRPRVLIVRSGHDKPAPFTHFLAETGLFDVYAVNGLDFPGVAKPKIWHLQLAANNDCRAMRTERDEMVVLTGWRTCAVATPVETAPVDGLVLYDNYIMAPHSWSSTRKNSDTPVAWTIELAVRQGSDEKLIAYDEFVYFPQMEFHFMVSPHFKPRPPPRRRVAISGTDIAAPEPAEFVLTALGIDERAIVPSSALSLDEQRAMVDRLSATSQPDDTQQALDLIAAAPADPAFRASMGRLASNPTTSIQMQLKYQPRWCEKIDRLLRYRDALIQACASSTVAADQCGSLGFPLYWFQLCSDDTTPIWRSNDKPARRVFIADIGGGQKTKVLLPRPAISSEVRVPADRGPLDIVIRNKGPRIIVFTGAASCIERLTVIDQATNAGAGIAGVAASRVRFVSPVESDSWINPAAPFSGALEKMLGIKPDTLLLNHDGDIDLADSIAPDRSAPPCAPTQDAPLQSGGRLRIDTSQIMTAPPLLPIVRNGGAAP